jgi:hypothetical protein
MYSQAARTNPLDTGTAQPEAKQMTATSRQAYLPGRVVRCDVVIFPFDLSLVQNEYRDGRRRDRRVQPSGEQERRGEYKKEADAEWSHPAPAVFIPQ